MTLKMKILPNNKKLIPYLENERLNAAYNFINKAKKIHGNKYDYSLVEYINWQTKIKIICPVHGIFEQTPNKHKNNRGCPRCARIKFIQAGINNAAKMRHCNNKKLLHLLNQNGFELVSKYIDHFTPVSIRCPVHGIITRVPNHIFKSKNNVCPLCSKRKNKQQDIINQFISVHGNKYDYSLVEYCNLKQKIKIICSKHGIFEQGPDHHRKGNNCPLCTESKGEKAIAKWLNENSINFERQKRIKEFNPFKPFDFYLPYYDLYIEYDGIQHFIKSNGSWGKNFEKQQERDLKRNTWCRENNINLLIITYLEDPVKILTECLLQFAYNKNQLT